MTEADAREKARKWLADKVFPNEIEEYIETFVAGYAAGAAADREPVEHREGIVEVYDAHGKYLGCLGERTWGLLRASALTRGGSL